MKKLLLLVLCLPLLQACTKKMQQPASVETTSVETGPAIVEPIQWPCWNNIWQNRGQVPMYFDSQRDIAFGINNKGYVLRREAALPTYRVWEYNISNGVWTPKGLFPGMARLDGTVVVVGTKAYFGLGMDFDYVTPIYYHDWWEYEPTTDQWTQKANFPAAARTNATTFAASSKAYVVGGYDQEVTKNYLKQTWQYDPALNTWEQKANLPGAARDEAAGFGIGSKGYVGTGRGRIIVLNNPVTFYYKDFYEYNAPTNTWVQKADYPLATRYCAFAFMIRGNGFIGGGYNASAGYRDLYMYDQLTNQWVDKADYPGYGTSPHHFGNLFHFSTLDHGYVIEEAHLDRDGEVPQRMWRYIKKQYCPN
jgi:N-acetylneuraminic acid mutarotase